MVVWCVVADGVIGNLVPMNIAQYEKMKAEGGERYQRSLERCRLNSTARYLRDHGDWQPRVKLSPEERERRLKERWQRNNEKSRIKRQIARDQRKAEKAALREATKKPPRVAGPTRAEIKELGGAAYAELLDRERAARAAWRERHAGRMKEIRASWGPRKNRPWKSSLVGRARSRGRSYGLEATITVADIIWPTHCPVLGIKLYYPERFREGGDPRRPDRASLDRWDNTKGYVPGNVYVISFRANTLKNNATAEELQAVALYARRKPDMAAPRLHLELVASSVRVA